MRHLLFWRCVRDVCGDGTSLITNSPNYLWFVLAAGASKNHEVIEQPITMHLSE